MGLTIAETESKLKAILSMFRISRDERTVFDYWYRLVLAHDVKGKQVHDARLVAAMLRHDISHLLTFNASDCARYSAITVVEPHLAAELGPAD